MPLPTEITEAMVDCLASCFFLKARMAAFLQECGVPEQVTQAFAGPKKEVWARELLAWLGKSEVGYTVQKLVLNGLCALDEAPDPNHNVDRPYAKQSLFRLKVVAMRYRESLACATFNTSDPTLDELLSTARLRFLQASPTDHRIAVEKLWDAWERLKSANGMDKASSVAALLDSISPDPAFRQVVESEARALTDIGNKFMIRHTEVGKHQLMDDEHIDYLFHRLFSLIRLILRKTDRGG